MCFYKLEKKKRERDFPYHFASQFHSLTLACVVVKTALLCWEVLAAGAEPAFSFEVLEN
jgi:hypothetical protein